MSEPDSRTKVERDAIDHAEQNLKNAQTNLDTFNKNFAGEIKALREKIENWPNFVTLSEEEKCFWTSEKDQAANLKLKNERNARNLSHAERSLDDLLVEKARLGRILDNAETQLVKAQAKLEAKEAELQIERLNVTDPFLDELKTPHDGFKCTREAVVSLFDDDKLHDDELLKKSGIMQGFVSTCATTIESLMFNRSGSEVLRTQSMPNLFPLSFIDSKLGRFLKLKEMGNQHHFTQTSQAVTNDKQNNVRKQQPDSLFLINDRVFVKGEHKRQTESLKKAKQQLTAMHPPCLMLGESEFVFGQLVHDTTIETGILVERASPFDVTKESPWEFVCLKAINLADSIDHKQTALTLINLAITVYKCMISMVAALTKVCPLNWPARTRHHGEYDGRRPDTTIEARGGIVTKKTSFFTKMDSTLRSGLYNAIKDNIYTITAEVRETRDQLIIRSWPVGLPMDLTSNEDTKNALQCVLKGLDELHGKGWVHADCSASNIIRDYNPYGKDRFLLIDFEMALYVGDLPKEEQEKHFQMDVKTAITSILSTWLFTEEFKELETKCSGLTAREALELL